MTTAAELSEAGFCMYGFHETDVAEGRVWPMATRDVRIGDTAIRCCDECAVSYEKLNLPEITVVPKES